MRRLRVLASAAALICGGPLAGQENAADIERGIVEFDVSEDEKSRFRACRTAAFVHLDEQEAREGLPHRYAETLLAIIDFTISEIIRDFRSDSLSGSRESLRVIESFFLEFSRTVAEEAERLRDLETREALLVECLPFVWRFAGERIDYLMLWRENAVDAPSFDATPRR